MAFGGPFNPLRGATAAEMRAPFPFLLLACMSASAAAPISPETRGELRRAAHDEAALRTAVIAAIARWPADLEAIVAEAVALAPQSRAAIAAAAASAFPAFAPRIRAAAFGPATASPAAASKWSGEVAVGGARTSGNTETGEASAGVKAEYDGVDWEHDFDLTFDYGSEDDSTTKQRLLSNFESRRDLNGRLYAFGFLEYEDDRFKRLRVRDDGRPGPRLPHRLAAAAGNGAFRPARARGRRGSTQRRRPRTSSSGCSVRSSNGRSRKPASSPTRRP
jgi:hypothetical protein